MDGFGGAVPRPAVRAPGEEASPRCGGLGQASSSRSGGARPTGDPDADVFPHRQNQLLYKSFHRRESPAMERPIVEIIPISDENRNER